MIAEPFWRSKCGAPLTPHKREGAARAKALLPLRHQTNLAAKDLYALDLSHGAQATDVMLLSCYEENHQHQTR
jgi:hypothetical protein